MLSESETSETAFKRSPLGLKLIAVVTAALITTLFFIGYAYLGSRHLPLTASVPVAEPDAPTHLPAGPAQVNVLVDDALLKAGETTIAGTVRNISDATLTNVTVELELYPRSGKIIDQAVVQVEPAELEPQQEGRYALKVKAKDYGYARLVALRAGSNSSLITYTSSPGRKRPPERIEAEMVPPNRAPRDDEFLNTPDNPARVP